MVDHDFENRLEKHGVREPVRFTGERKFVC